MVNNLILHNESSGDFYNAGFDVGNSFGNVGADYENNGNFKNLYGIGATPTTDINLATTGSGSYALYDPNTYKLVNVIHNDAIGVGFASGGPELDFNGAERGRGIYCEPGALESDKVIISATVGEGKDYATVALAEGAVAADAETQYGTPHPFAKRNLQYIADVFSGDYGAVAFDALGLVDFSKNNNIIFRAHEDHRFDGSMENKVFLRGNTYIPFFTADGFCASSAPGQTSLAWYIGSPGIDKAGPIIKNCVFDFLGSREIFRIGQNGPVGTKEDPIIIENCIGVHSGNHIAITFFSYTTGVHTSFRNCTFAQLSGHRLLQQSNAPGNRNDSTEFINNIFIGSPSHGLYDGYIYHAVKGFGNFNDSPYPMASYLLADDNTITTISSLDDVVTGNFFLQTPPYYKPEYSFDNVVLNSVPGPDVDSKVPTTDIVGNARSGSTVDAGAWQTSGAPGPVKVGKNNPPYPVFNVEAELNQEPLEECMSVTFNGSTGQTRGIGFGASFPGLDHAGNHFQVQDNVDTSSSFALIRNADPRKSIVLRGVDIVYGGVGEQYIGSLSIEGESGDIIVYTNSLSGTGGNEWDFDFALPAGKSLIHNNILKPSTDCPLTINVRYLLIDAVDGARTTLRKVT